MYLPNAFTHPAEFRVEIERVAQSLPPHVVSITHTLDYDWSGEPAVFFMVILADSATQRDRLLKNSNQVSEAIWEQVQPLEEWRVYPYFSFRSKSEQARLDERALA